MTRPLNSSTSARGPAGMGGLVGWIPLGIFAALLALGPRPCSGADEPTAAEDRRAGGKWTLQAGGVALVDLAGEESRWIRMAIEVEPELELRPSSEGRWTSGLRFVLSGRLRADGREEVEPRSSTARLRDAFLEWRGRGTLIRLGKQRQTWGVLDGYAILDQLQPFSFREALLEETDRSRLGQWMVNVRRNLGGGQLQGIWVPRPDGHELPEPGSLYDFVAPRFRFGVPTSFPSPPRRTLDTGGDLLAARFTTSVQGLDLSAVVLSGPEAQPIGRRVGTATEPILELYRRHRWLVGGTAAMAFGSTVLRGEVGWSFGSPFNLRRNNRLEEVRLDRLQAGFSLDLDLPAGLFASAQLIVDHVRHAPRALVRPVEDVIATLLLRRSFLTDLLGLELRWLGSAEGDGLVRLAATYRGNDRWDLRLGVDSLYGERDGIFGQYRDRDRLTLRLTTYF